MRFWTPAVAAVPLFVASLAGTAQAAALRLPLQPEKI
jgi:hypothetical protein